MTTCLRTRGFPALLSVQFLGAFNDNLLKMVISLPLAASAVEGGSRRSLVNAVFILPYLLFSGYAGFVADRFVKRRVLIATKSMEIGAMTLALAALVLARSDFLLAVSFLVATQATFFSPAKYGILPEMVPCVSDPSQRIPGNERLRGRYLAHGRH